MGVDSFIVFLFESKTELIVFTYVNESEVLQDDLSNCSRSGS